MALLCAPVYVCVFVCVRVSFVIIYLDETLCVPLKANDLCCLARYALPLPLPFRLPPSLAVCLNDRIYWLVNFFIISLNLIYPERSGLRLLGRRK